MLKINYLGFAYLYKNETIFFFNNDFDKIHFMVLNKKINQIKDKNEITSDSGFQQKCPMYIHVQHTKTLFLFHFKLLSDDTIQLHDTSNCH